MKNAFEKGLVKHLGVSNFNIKRLDEVLEVANIRPVTNQVECHPYLQQTELKAHGDENGVILTAYSPLGSKDRPKRLKKKDEPSLLENKAFKELESKYKASAAQIMLAWALARDTIVIPKSVNEKRMKENLDAADLEIAQGDIEKIDSLKNGYRFVDGSFWCPPGSPYTLEGLWG